MYTCNKYLNFLGLDQKEKHTLCQNVLVKKQETRIYVNFSMCVYSNEHIAVSLLS